MQTSRSIFISGAAQGIGRATAEMVWRCAHDQSYKVHWRIGWQTKLAYTLSRLSPAWMNRWVNGWLNRQ